MSFHKTFVNDVIKLTDEKESYNKRISNLEYEINRLKAVIRQLTINCDANISLDGRGSNDVDIDYNIKNTLILEHDNGAVLQEEKIEVDDLLWCDTCKQLDDSEYGYHSCS